AAAGGGALGPDGSPRQRPRAAGDVSPLGWLSLGGRCGVPAGLNPLTVHRLTLYSLFARCHEMPTPAPPRHQRHNPTAGAATARARPWKEPPRVRYLR